MLEKKRFFVFIHGKEEESTSEVSQERGMAAAEEPEARGPRWSRAQGPETRSLPGETGPDPLGRMENGERRRSHGTEEQEKFILGGGNKRPIAEERLATSDWIKSISQDYYLSGS